jgi:hypothetical protein
MILKVKQLLAWNVSNPEKVVIAVFKDNFLAVVTVDKSPSGLLGLLLNTFPCKSTDTLMPSVHYTRRDA